MLYSDYVYVDGLARFGKSVYQLTPAQLKRLRKKVNRATKLDRFFKKELV